ncbi:hypothetical protein [Erythrobacter sp. YT30]|uniref:hypothetical protein n=1 Tax=Erythrobacter sp. YT30 TaxID=1735012 RepID=UPI00076D2A7D|nr:hypothetical protein [Erythrobacter sp. YT30]KWV92049.1 hypothetical protein AUC45_12930 [Erythrobacter sp. YT30]
MIQHITSRLRYALLFLLFASLGLNSLAPAGYMIATSESGWPSVFICPDTHPLGRTAKPQIDQSMMDHANMDHANMGHGEGDGSSSNQSKDCALAGINKLATGANDPVILGLALAFTLLLGLAPRTPICLPRLSNLRPPLRGPPSFT